MKAIKAELIQMAINVKIEEMNLENGKYAESIKPKIEAEIAEKKQVIRKLSLLASRLN